MTSMACVDPPSLPPHLHPATQPTPTLRANHVTASHPSVRLAGSSLAGSSTSLQRRIVLLSRPNCLPPLFFILQERVGSSAGHGGIMQWPGFRGHFTHCLRGISRNASLHSHPLCSAEGPLTATLSGNALNIFVHRYSTESFRPHGF